MFISKMKAKSMLGVTLAACISAIATASPSKAEIDNIAELLVQTSDIMNQRLPMMIDSNTQWDSTFAGPGKILGYNYSLVNYSATQIDGSQFAKQIRPSMVDLVCNDPATQIFPENGVSIEFNVYDNTRNLVTRLKVVPSDCK